MRKKVLSALLVLAFVFQLASVLVITSDIHSTYAHDANSTNSGGVTRFTVLVLDTSGAVEFLGDDGSVIYRADPAIDCVKIAASRFVNDIINARGTNYIAIVTFNSTARTASGFSTNATALQSTIN